MKRSELIKQMESFSGSGFMNRAEFSRYMGYKDPHSIDRYLFDMPRINGKYSCIDLADRLMQEYECR